MLAELYIRNFAIIDELRMKLDPGFNVLTGETGTGKSIILDAVALVLGDRADTTMIRAGCSEAFVEATFLLGPATRVLIAPLLDAEQLQDEQDDQLIIARELRSNGRSLSRVNGRTVNLSLLRQMTEPLIDIHGQGDHLSLLKPRSHLPLLDAYAGLDGARATLAAEVDALRKVHRELNRLRQDERLLAQRLDMLRFQVQEIEASKLRVGEEEELREERVRLANAEHLMQYATEVVGLIGGLDDVDADTIVDRLGLLERSIAHLARYDDSQTTRLEDVQGLAFQFSELSAHFRDYLDTLEFNPGRLEFVEERMEMIGRLKRKYGEDIPAILAWHERALTEIDQIGDSEERVAEQDAAMERYLRKIGDMASSLSAERKAAALRLASAVEHQLSELRMAGTTFSVSFADEASPDGAYVAYDGATRRLAFDDTGTDIVEFLISANPGEPLKPLAKTASGGETSRLMLALKTVLAEADAAPTLIFDEIDQGIGGRVGDIAGRKLWSLAETSRHQVIVVTHLPQIAGYGDSHFHVSKQLEGGRTVTTVIELDLPGRVNELAAMMGSLGHHATGGAESILSQVDSVKRSHNQVKSRE